MFLSHPPKATSPSWFIAPHTVSRLSAITSRETSEYRIPLCPILMPSETVGAPKVCGTPPAARMPSRPFSASRSRWALQGVMSLKSDATPTIGFSKSSSVNPTARSIARLGARPGPPVVVRLVRVKPSDTGEPSQTARHRRAGIIVTDQSSCYRDAARAGHEVWAGFPKGANPRDWWGKYDSAVCTDSASELDTWCHRSNDPPGSERTARTNRFAVHIHNPWQGVSDARFDQEPGVVPEA